MDVDAACASVFVLLLEAVEPDDAGDDGVAPGSVDGEDFAGGRAMADDGAGSQVVADFIADLELTEGRLITSIIVTSAEAGSGDRKAGD